MADHKQRILVDADGTVTRGPGNTPYDFAPLNDGVRAFLGALKDRNYEIVVFSARSPVDAVRQFFKQNDLDRYVDGYTRVKKPARLILDDRVVPFEGDYDVALNRIDRFKPWWEEGNSKSCVMAMLPEDLAAKVKGIAAKVADADLKASTMGNKAEENGREQEIHVTVLYGIEGDDPEPVKRALEGKPPIKITLGKLGLFETPEHDVLKLAVDSPDLHVLNDAIKKHAPHTDSFKEYSPHVTCAYLAPGKGAKYLTLDNPVEGQSATLSSVTFSDRNNARQEIRLTGSD